jgi:hypothetical protein
LVFDCIFISANFSANITFSEFSGSCNGWLHVTPPALSDFLKSQEGMEKARTPNETMKSKFTKQPRDVLL